MSANPVKKIATISRSVIVMNRAGLIPIANPFEMLRSIRDLRRLGPAGGPFHIAGRRHPDSLGLVDELGELTFGDIDRKSWALADAWRAQGVSSESSIAVLCRDHRWLILAMSAASRLGATVVLMNTGFAPRQLAEVASREGATDLVYDDEFSELAAAADPSIRKYRAWLESDDGPGEGDTLAELVAAGSDQPFKLPRAAGPLVMLTSGTTGTPKGAPRQVRSPFAPAQFVDRVPLRTGEVTVLAAPAFHGTGLSQLLITVSLGSGVAMRRRFDPEATLALIDRHRATSLVVVPTMLQRMLDLPEETLARYDASSLRIILTAGAALPAELGNRATRRFGDVIHNLYGSTECAVATVATPEDWRTAPGTVGRTPVGCEVRLYDYSGNRVKTPGETGVVYIGNGIRFSGYTGGGSKDEIGGLLSSGDVGHFDEHGLLFIDGRADDMIVSGGENVYPAEVEDLLIAHPGISDAAVIGVEDADFGQRLKAFVVTAPGAVVSAAELQSHVKGNLARFKVPREVVFMDELPRNPTGKLLRAQLASVGEQSGLQAGQTASSASP